MRESFQARRRGLVKFDVNKPMNRVAFGKSVDRV